MTTQAGFIVVGVDGTHAARAALELALDEGVAHGCAVEVVTAWLWTSPYAGMNTVTSIAEGHRVAAAIQDQALQSASKRADVPVISRTVVHEHAGRALVERSDGARMLVVGSARKGGVRRAVLGSTSEYCVRHAPVPVVVVADPSRVKHRQAAEVEVLRGPTMSTTT
jgi:nucleotide-binding universal stress UspA family protein